MILALKHYCPFVFIILFLFSCSGSNSDRKEEKRVKHNFIVLLDLSDRLQNPNQIQRDKELISSAFYFFKSFVKQNMYIKSQDKFKVVIAPQQNDSKSELIELENLLRVNLEGLKISQKKKFVDSFEKELPTNIDKLYHLATINKNASSDFFGADIWQYFNEDLKTDIDQNAINHLYIITDGYIYFENYNHTLKKANRYSSFQFMSELRGNDWREKFKEADYGIIPTTQTYPNLQVVVLEIDPKGKFLNEYELVETIWIKWLNEMQIQRIEIQKVGPLDKIRDKIANSLGVSLSGLPIKTKPTETSPADEQEPTPVQLAGTFQGNLNGYIRELEIKDLVFSSDDSLQFLYTIKGQGNLFKNKKGYASISANHISFETLGSGDIKLESGVYTLSSEQNDWKFTKKK